MSFFYRPSLIKFNSSSWASGADLVLSDHGRDGMSLDFNRIENRERMASGKMRSKFIADKRKFSANWKMLPSRSLYIADNSVTYPKASAIDMIDFFEAVSGEFSMTVYGDIDTGGSLTSGQVFGTFSVFFSDFSSSIQKRGKNFDFWDINLSLEES